MTMKYTIFWAILLKFVEYLSKNEAAFDHNTDKSRMQN
jgi:hypothetical protein